MTSKFLSGVKSQHNQQQMLKNSHTQIMQNNIEKNEHMRKLIKSNSHTQVTLA